ncbi:MAG: DUF192 domain-containing protein [Candidatus Aenigmatarchaeota archaeon]
MQSEIFILLLLIFLSGCVEKVIEIYTSDHRIVKVNAEVADDNEERARGLMFRESLAKNNGMIFVFDKEMNVTFWMKNTFLPLDMIFISSNGTINEIKENVQPCYEDPCPIYPSLYPSKYVLEVNANFSKKNNIKVGDIVKNLE